MKYLLVSVVWLLSLLKWTHQRDIKIAIVGGGIGGTSCAYFLREIFDDVVEIYLYEGKRLGGRLTTTTISDGSKYESGGELIHNRNKYMSEFKTTFNLENRKDAFVNNRLSIFNGRNFDFIGKDNKIFNYLNLLWNYGFCKRHIKNYVGNFFDLLERIYKAQKEGESFQTTQDMLLAMGPTVNNFMNDSLYDSIAQNNNFDLKCLNGLIRASNMYNYGQHIKKIHAFSGSISMSTIFGQQFWAVKGGNKIVTKNLLESSKAHLIHEFVTKITYNHSMCSVTTTSGETHKYDYVVYAAPYTNNQRVPIEFKNMPKEPRKFGKYHRTVSTVIKGRLREAYFYSVINRTTTMSIVSNNETKNYFYSINNVKSINETGEDHTEKIWRVLSPKTLTPVQLVQLFEFIGDVKTSDWMAYPHYQAPTPPQSFQLANRIYHVNAIEWAASSMEMSCIGAKNVALLINKHYKAEALKEGNKLQLFGDHPQRVD